MLNPALAVLATTRLQIETEKVNTAFKAMIRSSISLFWPLCARDFILLTMSSIFVTKILVFDGDAMRKPICQLLVAIQSRETISWAQDNVEI